MDITIEMKRHQIGLFWHVCEEFLTGERTIEARGRHETLLRFAAVPG